ncbi:monothiol glutaredoxin grx5 [Phytophthora pseudosyringae]|uniref:Monothiol glutaredoxin grx5 n=1 Tax=Phytophthora pseudosyringae TaxID=221518 RepID=A0A8T1VMF3_9STRA|nr:monothiol glutaredoxin grx5 [Phytophthora pseudosyringae]
MVMNTIVRRVARSAARGSQRVAFAVQRAAAPALVVAAQQPRFFSAKPGDDDDSHSDFQPQYHAAKSTEKDEILKMIESHVKTYPVMLYMKGTPSAPQCGFSMQVVRILHAQGVSFDSVNVLDHPEIRDGVKEYSQWPTIPQLYVNGEFVGGCDIITDMSKSGELAELLADFKKN